VIVILKPKHTEREKKKKKLKAWLKKGTGLPYKLWRERVRERDKKCLMSGVGACSGELHVHHAIVEWGKSRLCRYIVDNGVLLCSRHHIWGVHSDSAPEFLREYLSRLDRKIPPRRQAAIKRFARMNKEKAWDYESMEKAILKLGGDLC
jgi:hypothetical protein